MRNIFILIIKILEIGNPKAIIKNFWRNRYLIQKMTFRDVSQRYKGSYLGIFWSTIIPLLMLCIYTFVFSVIFKAKWRPNDNPKLGEFAITLYAGMIAFNLFSDVVNRSPSIILNYPNYVKKVVFPLEILIVVITGSAFINSLIGLGLILIMRLFIFHTIPITVLYLPLLYIPLIFICLGLGWFLSSVGVYIRDTSQFVMVVVQMLYFLTPVFYSIDNVPLNIQPILKINPLSIIVTDFRKLLIWSEIFPLKEWAILTLITLFIALLGYIWFIGTKKGFADIL